MGDFVKARMKSRRKRKDKWSNRLAIIGILAVVISLSVVVNVRGQNLRQKEREYQAREELLMAQKAKEENRAEELEEYRVYVQTKQYIEQIAKEKLGLVKPDEILLKPTEK